MGSTHHRSAILKRLRETIEKTKDPETLTKLTAQYVKLNAQKRPRKSADVPSADSKGKASLLTRIHHNAVDCLSPLNKFRHFNVVEFEKGEKEHRKRTGQKLTEAEKEALWVYAIGFNVGQLTEEDRALLLADSPDPKGLTKIFEAYDADEAALKGC